VAIKKQWYEHKDARDQEIKKQNTPTPAAAGNSPATFHSASAVSAAWSKCRRTTVKQVAKTRMERVVVRRRKRTKAR
jgi:erythromycin esterase-like protein